MKIYIISDTHFNHTEIIKYCERPDDHENRMWKALEQIQTQDCLVHLGDVNMGADEEVHDTYIKPLKCRKVLIMGNHDSKSWSWYMEHGWDFVCDNFQLKYGGKIIHFSHKPAPWDGTWEVNVHGHLHNLGHRKNEYHELKQWHRLYAPELMGYRPIELAKFIQSGVKR